VADQAILFVEDDDSLRTVVATHLRARGWRVVEAASAERAAEILRQGEVPSLVLLDINLPGETGWDLLRRDGFVGPGAPPVVVVSATTIRPGRLREFGVAGYLPKPFALETLLEVCERYAGGLKASRSATDAASDQGEST
jgi:DNA-binding response OmpR family regulator